MKVTIKDVANFAQVSTSTVSRVLNNPDVAVKEATRQKIIEAVQILNYTPNAFARGLRTKESQLLGMIVPDITNVFFSVIFKGAETATLEKGFSIILCNTDDQPQKAETYIRSLKERGVDGFIIACAHIESILDNLLADEFPCVFVNRKAKIIQNKYVIADNILGAKLAAEYLIKQGHTKIGHIAGPLYTDVGLNRMEGYRAAIKDKGLPFSLEYVVESEFNSKAGYLAALDLLKKKPDITAIFAADDSIAIGVIKACNELGLSIPNKLSLVGFSDQPVSSMLNPSLTTVQMPLFEMGYLAGEMLTNIITKKPIANNKIILKPQLVIRNSVSQLR